MTRNYGTATTRVRHRLFGIADNNGHYGEVDCLQIPADSVVITNTAFTKDYTAGTISETIATFSNFDFDSSYFSYGYSNAQKPEPDWITGYEITNPSGNNIQLNLTLAENTTGSPRTANATFVYLDKNVTVTITQNAQPGTITAQYNPATLKGKSGTYLDPLTVTNVSNLSVSNSRADKFTTSIVTSNNNTYLQIDALTGNTCQSESITDTAVITGVDGNNNTITLNVPITQSTEDADYNFSPSTGSGEHYDIDWRGETIDFTFNNQGCNNLNEFYHLTGISRVWYNDNYGDQGVDLSYTTAFVNNLLHCYVVFPQNSGTRIPASGTMRLHFTTTDDFVPGPVNVSYSNYEFVQEEIPSGTITITSNDPLWYNAINSEDVSESSNVANTIAFTATDIDTTTLAYSFTDSSMVASASFTNDGLVVQFYPNSTSNEKSTTLTISATDYKSDTISDTIVLKQVPYSDRVKLAVTSPSGTSSVNPYVIQGTTMTIGFDADNLNSFAIGGTMASNVTNTTFTNTSANHYEAELTLSSNTGISARTGTLYVTGVNTVSGSPLAANWQSGEINVSQKAVSGSITTDLNAIVVPASSTYDHRDVKVTYSRLTGALTPSISGDVSGTFSWETYNNERYLIFTPADNETQNTLTGTITISGTDYNGDTITTSYSVTQKPYNPMLHFEDTDLGTIRLLYDESTRTIPIICKGISYLSVSVDDPAPSLAYSFTSFYTSDSLTKVDDDNYTYTINTSNNNSYTRSNTAYLDANISTEFGKNPWIASYTLVSGVTRPSIIKCGLPGTITITPNSTVVNETAGSTSFTVNRDQYVTNDVSASHSGTMNITAFNYTNSGVSVSYGANEGSTNLVETITVSARDYQGLLVNATATITQQPEMYLRVDDTPKTVEKESGTVTFQISDCNVSNLSVSTSGSSVTSATITDRTGGHLLTVVYGANSDYQIKTSTFTITGTTVLGGTLTATAVLNQKGPNGSIVLSPNSVTVTKAAGQVSVGVTLNGLAVSDISIYGGSFVTNTTLTSSSLTVEYSENNTGDTRDTSLILSGTDYLGNNVVASLDITQRPYNSLISITPSTQTLDYGQNTATYMVDLQYVDNIQINLSGDTSFISDRTLSNGVLTVTTADFNTQEAKTATITISGTGLMGTVSDSATLTKYGPDGTIAITPISRKVGPQSGTTTYSITYGGITADRVTTLSGGAWASQSTSGSTITVTYGEYLDTPLTWNENRQVSLVVTGTDYKGVTRTSNTVTLTQYASAASVSVSPATQNVPFENATADYTVALEGPVSVTNVTVTNGTYEWVGSWGTNVQRTSTLRYHPTDNPTFSERTLEVTITCTTELGDTITRTVEAVQAPKEGGIVISPASRTVTKDGGSTTYNITVDGIVSSTLAVSYSGSSIISTSFNSDKTVLTVNYSTNTTVATKTNTITVAGSDPNSHQTSAQATLIQTGIDPVLSADNISIGSSQANATAFVQTNGVDNLSVSFSGNANIVSHTITSTVGGYNINLVTTDNLTNTPMVATATVTGTVTVGQYEGQTRTTTFTITKYGVEGVVVIDASTTTIRKDGATLEFDITLNNIDLSTVTASMGTFNNDKTKLTVVVGENTSSTDRTINITVSGTDYNGETKSATVSITQYGVDPFISIIPASKSIAYNTTNVTFAVTVYKASNLSVDIDGDIDVTNYQLDGSTLYITVAENEDRNQKSALIMISGTDELDSPVSGSATLYQSGVGGGIVVNSDYVIPSNAGKLVIDYVLDEIDENTIVASASGDINFTELYVNRGDNAVILSYGANSTSENKTGRIVLTGVGEDDLTKVVIISIEQLSSDYTIVINPSEYDVAYTSGSKTFSVTTTGITSETLAYSGSMDVTSCTYSSGTITAVYDANSDDTIKYLYLTINGITSNGYLVSSSSVLRQAKDNTGGAYVFSLSPGGQTPKYIEASATRVTYTIQSLLFTEEVPYDITGFILSGRWGTRPTVEIDDFGYPLVKVPLNTHSEERVVRVCFTQDYSGYTLNVVIVQDAGVEADVNPIWKEFKNSVDANTFIEYHINLDGDIIYAGKAYKYPDASKITWSINDTVSNYLGNGIQFVEGIHQIPDYSKDFYMETNTGEQYLETFYNSWAYKDADYIISDPIDNRIDQRQWLPVSFLTTNYDMITVGGRTYAALQENDGWTVMTKVNNYIVDCNAGIVVTGEDGSQLTYKIASGDYVLYYANAYGGWDSLLCTGTVKKTDNIEHLNYRRKSADQSQFSKVNYQNNITPTWSLNTGITIDGQKMYHLLESTMVYLHNLETNEIIPVVITNAQCEYLTYTNNGKKPYFYNITVEESNQKMRK